MSKSDKMYAKSPKIEKDKDGKPGIKKPEKADAEDMGVSDNTNEMPVDAHEQERQSMHKRHEEELKSLQDGHHKAVGDMNSRHEKDLKEMHKRHAGSTGTEKTGGEDISKTEETKKEDK